MDIKQDYREESNLDVYAEHSLNYANYTNEYVKWLEAKLTLTDVSGMFSEEKMEQAWTDGVEAEQQRCGEFDIENYC